MLIRWRLPTPPLVRLRMVLVPESPCAWPPCGCVPLTTFCLHWAEFLSFFFGSDLGKAGKALGPDGTRESSRNQESEQSSAIIVPQ